MYSRSPIAHDIADVKFPTSDSAQLSRKKRMAQERRNIQSAENFAVKKWGDARRGEKLVQNLWLAYIFIIADWLE